MTSQKIAELRQLVADVILAEDLETEEALSLAQELQSAAEKLRKKYTLPEPDVAHGQQTELEADLGEEEITEEGEEVTGAGVLPTHSYYESFGDGSGDVEKEEEGEEDTGALQPAQTALPNQSPHPSRQLSILQFAATGQRSTLESSQLSQTFPGPTYSTLYLSQPNVVPDETSRKRQREAESLVKNIKKSKISQCGCSYADGEGEKQFSDKSKESIRKLAPAIKTNRHMFHYMVAATLHRLKSCPHCVQCPNKIELPTE